MSGGSAGTGAGARSGAVIWRLVRYRPFLYLLDTLLWLSYYLLHLVPGLLARAFIDSLTGEAAVSLTVGGIITLVVVTAAVHMAVQMGGIIVDTRFRMNVSALLRRNLLAGVLRRPGARAIAGSPGEAISTFREDVDELENAADWTIDAVGQIIYAVAALAVMMGINARITVLTVFPLAAVLLVAQAATTRIKRYRFASRQATERVTGALGEILGAAQAIQIANAEPAVRDHFRRLNDERRHLMVRDRLLTQVLNAIFANSAALGTGLVLLLAAGAMRQGDFTVGDFALFVAYLETLANFTNWMGQTIAQFKQAGVSFWRMITLLRGGDAVADEEELAAAVVAYGPVYLEAPVPAVAQPVRDTGDELKTLDVRGLTYRHGGGQPANEDGAQGERRRAEGVADVSFSLEAGSFTVITGRIGAGKTTLLRALLGLLPKQAGEIWWNGKLVADLAEFFVPPRSAYMPQVPQLLSASLRENLLLGLAEENADVAGAIWQAVLEADVAEMAAGLETPVGPRGVRLSGGQIQRVAAARTFVRQPALLVFDDLSSALDVETERLLWQRLFEHHGAAGHVTCLVVSHRRPALRRADQIIVLQDGVIAERGNHAELLEQGGLYADMWARQREADEAAERLRRTREEAKEFFPEDGGDPDYPLARRGFSGVS